MTRRFIAALLALTVALAPGCAQGEAAQAPDSTSEPVTTPISPIIVATAPPTAQAPDPTAAREAARSVLG